MSTRCTWFVTYTLQRGMWLYWPLHVTGRLWPDCSSWIPRLGSTPKSPLSLGVSDPNLTQCVTGPHNCTCHVASKSIERFKQGARLWQTTGGPRYTELRSSRRIIASIRTIFAWICHPSGCWFCRSRVLWQPAASSAGSVVRSPSFLLTQPIHSAFYTRLTLHIQSIKSKSLINSCQTATEHIHCTNKNNDKMQ